MRIGVAATSNSTDQNYADYVATNETLADEFKSGPILTSSNFDAQVSQQIQSDMPLLTQRYGAQPDLGNWHDSGAIGGALSATRTHALVTITVTWNTQAGAWAIAHAVGEVSTAHIANYLDYEIRDLSSSTPDNKQPPVAAEVVTDASTPTVNTTTSGTPTKTTTLLMLLIVALVIAIALAFLVEYLDDRIRKASDVAQLLQLPVYGEIPCAPSPGHTQPGRAEP